MRVGIWIRVSTEDQAAGESPENHEARARMYAEVKDWNVSTVYNLSGVSGKSVWDHPEAVRMREDVAAGRIDALIFSKLARLARSTRELLDFSDFFREHRADLVSLGESIDTSTPSGRLFYTLIAAMAEWEREEISARVAAAVPVRAALGKNTGGQAPYGYRWSEEGKLEVDSEEAPVRRLMYELFLEERRIKTVARRLNDAGHRTRRGAKWSGTSVRRLLLDPTAKGKHRANYTTSRGEGKAWDVKPKDEWVYVDVEPIVSEETWNAVHAILMERKKKFAKRPAKRVRHLFAGRLYCTCGAKMYVPSNQPKYVCQDCRAKIPSEDIETVFVEELRHFALSPELIAEYLEDSEGELAEKRALLESLQSRRVEVSAEMEKLYRLYLDDEISTRQFGERNRPLEARRDEIDAELPRLQGELDALSVGRLSREQVASEGLSLAERWCDLTDDDKRAIVETAVERIEVGDGEIRFDLAFLPSPELVTKRQHNVRGSSPPAARSGRGR